MCPDGDGALDSRGTNERSHGVVVDTMQLVLLLVLSCLDTKQVLGVVDPWG